MKRLILLALLFGISTMTNAQLHLNAGVDTTSIKSKLAVDFMNNYIKDFKEDRTVNYAEYYSKADCERYVRPDKIAYSLIGDMPVYIMGNSTILSIKEAKEIVELKLLFADVKEDNQINVNFISNHYISVVGEKPKFIIPLELKTQIWQQTQLRNINFHFPPYHQFDEKRANEMIDQIKQLEKEWDLPTETIDYYFANTNKEIQEIKGFDFNFYMGKTEKPSGLADTKDNLIFCSGLGENYFHEVVHIYLNKEYPSSPLKEGIAVFYGGNMGKPLLWHLKQLNEYLQKNPTVNLTNPQEFYYLDEQTNPQYTIQGFICELVFQEKGVEGLKQLMNYTSMAEIYEQEFKVEKGQEDAFVMSQISEYCKKK